MTTTQNNKCTPAFTTTACNYQQKYGSVDINSLINYKAMLIRKAKREGIAFSELIKEFYS